MPHLSKTEIERRLLAGISVPWNDGTGKTHAMFLGTARERRLFKFVLSSNVREALGLSAVFIEGLQSAFDASDDPASIQQNTTAVVQTDVWRLKQMETEGFGGINVWQGKAFTLAFDGVSLLLEGPNGSGKSSLTGALVWALSGERPRDHAPDSAHIPKPVFDSNDQAIGEWPPLATYPPSEKELSTPPNVRVKLTFVNQGGHEALVERVYSNGTMKYSEDPQFNVPAVLIDTGLLMPARLSSIRLDEGRSRLTDAVQKLTGLDDLIAIANLTDGLTHKSREYLSYKKADLRDALREFEAAIKTAREETSAVNVAVPAFAPSDTNDASGPMAALGKSLADKSSQLTAVIAGDIGNKVDLTALSGQNEVVAALGAAREDLSAGLDAIPFWKALSEMRSALTDGAREALLTAIKNAEAQAAVVFGLHKKAQVDTKFQLKALSARWHQDHMSGEVNNCPVCEQSLASNPALKAEIDQLRSAGRAATRTLEDSLTTIQAEIDEAFPRRWRSYDDSILTWNVRDKLRESLAAQLVQKDRYSKVLVRFGAISSECLEKCPKGMPTAASDLSAGEEWLKQINGRIKVARCLIAIVDWYESENGEWQEWWKGLVEGSPTIEPQSAKSEGLDQHLKRLSDALAKSGPYRKSALAMREAWKKGKVAPPRYRQRSPAAKQSPILWLR